MGFKTSTDKITIKDSLINTIKDKYIYLEEKEKEKHK